MFQFIAAAGLAAVQPVEPTTNPGSDIALAETRGLRLFQAYRIAPDAAAKSKAVLKDRIGETYGYVITTSANGQLLTFVGRSDEGKPYAIWRGR